MFLMPNYIYPEAIESYVATKLKKLPSDFRELIISKVVKYIKTTNSFAEPSHISKDHLPDWAKRLLTNGELLHRFKPNEQLEKDYKAYLLEHFGICSTNPKTMNG